MGEKIDRTGAMLFITVIVVMLALVIIMLRVVDSSEENIAKIKNTKVEFSRTGGRYFDEDDCAARIKNELDANPEMTSANYPAFTLTEKCMQHISRMHALKELAIADSDIDDGLFSYITSLPLKSLVLRATEISDKPLSEIAKIHSLVRLDLSATNVTDKGIQQLLPLKNLQYLNLEETLVTDKCIPTINKFANLYGLHISKTAVTDAGLAAIAMDNKIQNLGVDYISLSAQTLQRFSKVRALDVRHCHLTDKELAEIAKLRHLKRLDVSENPRLSKDALLSLKAVKTLEYLRVNNDQFPPQLLSEIKKSIPHLVVTLHQSNPSNIDVPF